jgi:hypothetical protein
LPIRAGGKLLRLGDIATIRRGFEDPPSVLVRSRGAEAVLLGVVLAKGENGLALGQRLDAFVDAETARLPLGITFLAMPLMGINLDRITLGALIITLGLLVDDAIISVEMMLVKIAEPQTVAARTNEEVRGGTRFFPGLPHGVQSCPRYPCFYGRAVSCNGELHHQYSKNQPFSVGFFSPIPASAGAVSGHGLASAATLNPAFSSRRIPLCSPFSLVVSRACARSLPVLVRVSG